MKYGRPGCRDCSDRGLGCTWTGRSGAPGSAVARSVLSADSDASDMMVVVASAAGAALADAALAVTAAPVVTSVVAAASCARAVETCAAVANASTQRLVTNPELFRFFGFCNIVPSFTITTRKLAPPDAPSPSQDPTARGRR